MRFAIGVGSNLGDRAAQLRQAAAMLDASGLARVAAAAEPIDTAPVGGPPGQPAFLNGALIIVSDHGPHQLLHLLQRIEAALGRTRTVADGPRTIDLDLLLADAPMVVTSPVLRLPHPQLHRRAFVLAPLAAIAGGWRHPLLERTIGELWRDFPGEPPR